MYVLLLSRSRPYLRHQKMWRNHNSRWTLLPRGLKPIIVPSDLLPSVNQGRDKGASSWLPSCMPLREQGLLALNKQEFRDLLRMRYNLPLEELPSSCTCGSAFSVNHALSCKKGGFVAQRHDGIQDTSLESVQHTRYLGVTISDDLRWNRLVADLTGRANKLRGLLRRNLSTCDTRVKEAAYLGLIRPLLEYASQAWDPYTDNLSNEIEKIQRRAARFVTSDYQNY